MVFDFNQGFGISHTMKDIRVQRPDEQEMVPSCTISSGNYTQLSIIYLLQKCVFLLIMRAVFSFIIYLTKRQ
jgi:hypothetical protein